MSSSITRREFVHETMALTAGVAMATGGVTGSALAADEKPAPASLPKGKIKDFELSRLMLGGNLISGYSHSRDLPYVSSLMKRYNTEAKILETLEMAEANGIDSVNTAVWDDNSTIVKHQRNGGKMRWVAATRPLENGDLAQVKQAIDQGADIVYIQGGAADQLLKAGKFDWVAKAIEYIKAQGIPAGLAAHTLAVIETSERDKIEPDFYQKTLHTLDYPSAPPKDAPPNEIGTWDNGWCPDPAGVIEFMSKVTKPWIAFKVMAAGAITPRAGFQHAFANGADFVLAGMFDFQIAEDAAIAREVLSNVQRPRPWRG